MAPEKATEMVLNVDLKCSGCYKKVKKVIAKVPQIRDQVFDVDKNKVKIIVVCCSPEKIRDKLCYKGGGAIQSIEIIEKSDKPKETDKPKLPVAADKPKPAATADKPKEAEKAKPVAAKPASDKPKDAAKPKEGGDKPKQAADKPKEGEKPKPAADKPKDGEKPKQVDKPKEGGEKPKPAADKPKDVEKPKEAGPPKRPDAEVAKMVYEPAVHGYPPMYPTPAYPAMVGYGQYYNHGYGGSPYEHGYGYGMPVAPPVPPSYGGFGYNGYNNNTHYSSNNDYGGEDEDEQGCSIM